MANAVTIPDDLRGLCRPITWFKPNPTNYRKHPQAQIDQIAASLLRYGVRRPAVAQPTGILLAGHGVIEAAKSIGMTEFPVTVADDLASIDATGFMIADNRLPYHSEDDQGVLGELLRQLQAEDALEGTGYDDGAVDALLKELTVPDFAPVGIDEQGRLDQKAPITCPECGHTWHPK